MKDVIITIDTEGHDGDSPVEKLIWGKVDNKEYGIPHIMDICDKYKAQIIFFVDFAEAWDYGEEKIRKVVEYIKDRGHEVGVHIHPDHMKDPERLFLWEYSYEEQYEMIEKCTNLYKKILKKRPIAFRAGKYGANRDTLEILNKLGYILDFSQFYGQKWCGISPPVAYVSIQNYKDLIEVPVTIFKSFSLFGKNRYDKIDAVMDSSEYLYVMEELGKSSKNITVSLFFHSFSLLNWRKDPNNPSFDSIAEKKFIKTLEYIKNSKNFQFITLEELILKNYKKIHVKDSIENIIDISNNKIISLWFIFKMILRIRKENKKAKIIYIALNIIILFFSICLIFFLKKI